MYQYPKVQGSLDLLCLCGVEQRVLQLLLLTLACSLLAPEILCCETAFVIAAVT